MADQLTEEQIAGKLVLAQLHARRVLRGRTLDIMCRVQGGVLAV